MPPPRPGRNAPPPPARQIEEEEIRAAYDELDPYPVIDAVADARAEFEDDGRRQAIHVLDNAKGPGGLDQQDLEKHWVAGTWVFRSTSDVPEDVMVQGFRLTPERENFTTQSCAFGKTYAGIATSLDPKLSLTRYGQPRLFFYAIWLPNEGSPDNGLGGFNAATFDSANESKEVLLFYAPPGCIKSCWGPISELEIDEYGGKDAGLIKLQALYKFENTQFQYGEQCSDLKKAMGLEIPVFGTFPTDSVQARAKRGAWALEKLNRRIEAEELERDRIREEERRRQNEPTWPDGLDPVVKEAAEKLMTTNLVMNKGDVILTLKPEEAEKRGVKFNSKEDRLAVDAFCERQLIIEEENRASKDGITRAVKSLIGDKPVEDFVKETRDISDTSKIIGCLRED
ncbi:MAG: hypothetical protein ABMA15_02900 [Vicinamibacterales bacterium]